MQSFRKEFVSKLKSLLENQSGIYCAWEGGSAATGFLDEYSDFDLSLICDDEEVEKIFNTMEKYLEKNYGISKKFRLPEPTWHGHSQCFYLLKNTPDFFYVDLLIEKLSAGNRFMESDRHGNSIVWFDKKKLFDPTPTPKDQIAAKGRRIFNLIKDSYWLLILDAKKQILRKNTNDAYVTYYQLINRLAPLLNLKYRPAKSDFGLRYTYRDFPETESLWLEQKFKVDNLKQMWQNIEDIEAKYHNLILELQDRWN
jgi:predicted nucleotidyltransferase